MTLRDGKIEVRGWYVAIVILWLFTGLPFLLLGVGLAGGTLFTLLWWLPVIMLIFAPLILAPYGIRRVRAGTER